MSHPQTPSSSYHEENSLDENINLYELTEEEEDAMKQVADVPTFRQKVLLATMWSVSGLYGLAACFPEKVGFLVIGAF